MSTRKPRRKELPRICEKCSASNGPRAAKCATCGGHRFAPSFVRQLRKVNRNFYVQITEPAEDAKNRGPRATLYKWWPGGHHTLHIPTADQWDSVKRIIDQELAPYLKWQTRRQLTTTLKAAQAEGRATERDIKALVQHDPELLPRLLKGIKLDKVTADNVDQIATGLTDLAAVLLGADESLRRAIRRHVKQLPAHGAQALDALSDLMEQLTLAQITAVANEVHRRVGLLKIFKERIEDDRTHEIQGDRSIHRLLEGAMWIVDERYWLMHSNTTLRRVVADRLAKEHKTFAKKRPDFVCGEVDGKLIIIEIKRPSHTLTITDLNQLERYVLIIQDHSNNYANVEGILVGRRIDPDVKRVLRLRGNRFRVRTYTDLIGDAERRYKEYLDALAE